MAAKPAPAKPAATAAKPEGKKRLLIPLLIGVVVAALAGGLGAYFAFGSKPADKKDKTEQGEEAAAGEHEESEAAAASKKPPTYIDLGAAFVVNLQDEGGDRYLQVEVQLTSRQPKAEEKVTAHMPVIRNRLLMLFSQNNAADLRTREQKEKLQENALKEVQTALEEATGNKIVDGLFFTSFVTQ